MVTLKDFETYKLSTTSFQIFYFEKGEWHALKGELEGAHRYFVLWKNGERKRVSLWTIVRDNWTAISIDIMGKRQDH